jgi:hypothetical protein
MQNTNQFAHLARIRSTNTTLVAPAARQHSERPSSGTRLARGIDALLGEVHLARGPYTPSGEIRLARGPYTPSGVIRLARGLSPTP